MSKLRLQGGVDKEKVEIADRVYEVTLIEAEVNDQRIMKLFLNDISELVRLNEELRRISRADGLTGLANRRYFDEFLQREWLRARRNQECLALIMIDVDEFKSYNDYYGHLHGQAVNFAFTSEKDGIKFELLSADYLKFCPKLIKLTK